MKRIGIIELTPTSITLALNEVEDDELDLISSQLAEFIYYHDTNK